MEKLLLSFLAAGKEPYGNSLEYTCVLQEALSSQTLCHENILSYLCNVCWMVLWKQYPSTFQNDAEIRDLPKGHLGIKPDFNSVSN